MVEAEERRHGRIRVGHATVEGGVRRVEAQDVVENVPGVCRRRDRDVRCGLEVCSQREGCASRQVLLGRLGVEGADATGRPRVLTVPLGKALSLLYLSVALE